MDEDKDDLKILDILSKHYGVLILGDEMALARLRSDITEFVFDARIEERMRATGEDQITAEGNVVANLRPGEEDRSL